MRFATGKGPRRFAYPEPVSREKTNIDSSAPAKACAFCQVLAHGPDAHIIFEDAISLAFLDHRPLFPGHCLLIPKQHYETLIDLPEKLIGPLFTNAQFLSKNIQETMKAEGSFVAMNNVVSQSVPHFHIHIVPRSRGDGLRGFFWPRQKMSEEELRSVQKALVDAIKTR